MRHKDGAELREAQGGMPIPVAECPGVYHCGFHSEKSFGATSYVIVREEGNIMMVRALQTLKLFCRALTLCRTLILSWW